MTTMLRRTGPSVDFDMRMMRIALGLARRGLGRTAFNPSVGAVIADETTGRMISGGWTQPGGRPHAEKDALRRAGDQARGKTMYVTLEPCAHTGRIPTCADAVLKAGLKRLVCAIADPNEIIAGRGFEQLVEAGVAVEVGLLAPEARWVTAGHILKTLQGRPFVQLKLAVSADGRIAPGSGSAPVWVTGPQARSYGHWLRAQADAVIVGVGTILADDPDLTCRLPGMADRSPLRVVLDTHLRTPVSARVTKGRPTHIFTGGTLQARGSAVVEALPMSDGHVDPVAVLARLAKDPIRRVLIEGAPRVAQSFLGADLVDEVVLFQSSIMNDDRGIEPLGPRGLAPFSGAGWSKVMHRYIGSDTMTVYHRNRPGVLT
jgi:diaminohydroxyphosphoribosylaminopyrimidine deaminase / 5-amino-6-(5-phosphoribosylamino)uracil reductase